MKIIEIKTQAEWDALPVKFDEATHINITGKLEKLTRKIENSVVVLSGSASVEYVSGSARVGSVYGSASVGSVYGSARVGSVYGSASVGSVSGSARVGSVYGSARVGSVYGSARVGSVYGSASVEYVSGSARVGSVYGSARVGSVYGSASVGSVYDSASVGSVSGSASVGSVSGSGVVRIENDSTVLLFGFAVAFLTAKAKAIKKSKHTTVKRLLKLDWFQNNAVEKKKTLTLFKRVSKEFKTQEGTPNETVWSVGATLTHASWNPTGTECGGKYHACSRPGFCDQFRSAEGDRYVAIAIALKDVYAWPNPQYPHKIGFRKGTVLHEVNQFGVKIEVK